MKNKEDDYTGKLPIPLKSRVMIKVDNKDTVTAGGIIIDKRIALDNIEKAEVLAVGKEVDEIEVGDFISYKIGNGRKITHEGEDYLFLMEDLCICKF